MDNYSPETVTVRRRALAHQFRATQGRLRSIQESDLREGIRPDLPFLDAKEIKAIEGVSAALDKLEKHLGAVSRRLER